jgi:FAD synthetase
MVFGTFDVFHKGHESFLNQAKKHGDYLIVVIARDRTVLTVKRRKTENKEQDRLRILKSSGLVDKAVLGNLGDKYLVIKIYKPDVICLGYDQKNFVGDLKKKLREFGFDKTSVVRLKSYYPRKYKSSRIRR